MEDQKRFILTIVLTVIILSAYSLIFRKPPTKELPPPQIEEKRQFSRAEVLLEEPEGPESIPSRAQAKKRASLDGLSYDNKTSDDIIETSTMRILLTQEGGAIKEIYLKEHAASSGEGSLRLLHAEAAREGILFIEEINQRPLDRVLYVRETKRELREASGKYQIEYVANIEDDYRITKTFIFPNDSYSIELRVKIENLSKSDRMLSYSLIGASRIDKSSMLDKRFTNIGVFSNDSLSWQSLSQAVKLGKNEEILKIPGAIDWITIRDAYYSAITIPYQDTSYAFIRWLGGDRLKGNSFSVGLKTKEIILPANSSVIHRYNLYVGPTILKELRLFGLEAATNYGKLNGICQILIRILGFFYGVFHNYGVAIIMLVLLISLCTYPLTLKNIKSMHQMQAVQPHLARLKEIHKDDQRKLQSEMMKLYREHKVNPLGGCLPMLLQMPIFISLYMTLARSAELRGSNFLWIKDLSLPDALFKLPFSLPIIGNNFNLLPILMIGAMMAQQKSSMGAHKKEKNQQQDMQKSMMIMMPIVFGIMFYNLPSGLVLYWTTNTIIMASMHYLIKKKLSKPPLISEEEWQAGER